jgi:hypothetical protein
MAEIVNLNKARKSRDRAAREAGAAANRVKHGRTGAEKLNDRREQERRRTLLEGARRDDADR